MGYFDEEKEWFVEKNMLNCGNDNILLVPNVLISSKNPIIPVANASSQPHFIWKGVVLATIVDLSQYFDTPSNAEQWWEMSSKAEVLAAIIAATCDKDDIEAEAEDCELKTAAMPDIKWYLPFLR